MASSAKKEFSEIQRSRHPAGILSVDLEERSSSTERDPTEMVQKLKRDLASRDRTQGPIICPQTLLEASVVVGVDLQTLPCCVARIVHRLCELIIRATLNDISSDEFSMFLSDLNVLVERSLSTPVSDIAESAPAARTFLEGFKKCDHCEQRTALVYCDSCGDHFCAVCFDELHAKGNRACHSSYRIHLCRCCNRSIAKVEHPFTHEKLCEECFTFNYVPMIDSDDDRDIRPKRIQMPELVAPGILRDKRRPHEEWIPFHDEFGSPYFFNFKTEESFRHKPIRYGRYDPSINTTEPVVPQEECDVVTRMGKYKTGL